MRMAGVIAAMVLAGVSFFVGMCFGDEFLRK